MVTEFNTRILTLTLTHPPLTHENPNPNSALTQYDVLKRFKQKLNVLKKISELRIYDVGQLWQTVYTLSQGDDGLSRIDDVAADSSFGLTTSYSLTPFIKDYGESERKERNLNDAKEMNGSGSGSWNWNGNQNKNTGNVERRYSAGGARGPFPLLISTGSYKATGKSRTPAIQPLSLPLPLPSSSSSSSSASSPLPSTRDSIKIQRVNTDINTKIQTQNESEQQSLKCRVTLDFSFQSMKYFNLLEQRSASAVDAIASLELIGVFKNEEGLSCVFICVCMCVCMRVYVSVCVCVCVCE